MFHLLSDFFRLTYNSWTYKYDIKSFPYASGLRVVGVRREPYLWHSVWKVESISLLSLPLPTRPHAFEVHVWYSWLFMTTAFLAKDFAVNLNLLYKESYFRTKIFFDVVRPMSNWHLTLISEQKCIFWCSRIDIEWILLLRQRTDCTTLVIPKWGA